MVQPLIELEQYPDRIIHAYDGSVGPDNVVNLVDVSGVMSECNRVIVKHIRDGDGRLFVTFDGSDPSLSSSQNTVALAGQTYEVSGVSFTRIRVRASADSQGVTVMCWGK